MSEQAMNPILPRKLKEGDTIGIIAPASPFPPERIPKTEENMRQLGLNVKWSKNLRKEFGHLAGSDQERIDDIHEMFSDPEVNGIWCIRGGYGCTRIIPHLNYELIRKNPKILVGYSDVTALHHAIHMRTGLICFHGPVGSSTLTPYAIKHLRNTLMSSQSTYKMHPSPENAKIEKPGFSPYVITAGKAEGILVGGNLSLLAAMCGTDFQMNLKDKILLIEDVGEDPYRIDRMLTQLLQVYDFEQLAGIALGIFSGCEAEADARSLTLRQTLEDRLGGLKIPIAYGFSFGHIDNQCTLPIGARCRINTNEMSIEILEQVNT